MKRILSLMIVCFGLLSACNATTGKSGDSNEETAKLIVYYFHSTHRCMTCNAIEKNTKETLDTYFKKETDAGDIKFIALNAEKSENKDLVEKYEIWGSSLVLVKLVDGKEDVENLTDFAFAHARKNADKFKQGLKDKITEKLQ